MAMLSYHGAPFQGRAHVKEVKASASRRRGLASLMAMLYLVVFAALALGFYAQTNMSVQVSNNERRSKESLAAAEAGLQFIRYQLSRITIPMMPVGTPQLTDDQVFEEVAMDLQAAITEVAVGDIIYDTDPLDDATNGVDPPRIEIPSDPTAYIAITEQGPWFRCTLQQSGRDMIVTTVGKSANGNTTSGGRAVQVRFKAKEWPNTVFSYGMASPGAVSLTSKYKVVGNPDSQAAILSTYAGGTPITIGSTGATVSAPAGTEGNITLMAGASNPSYVGTHYTVAGQTSSTTINTNIKRITEAPEWPTPDISVFTPYATTRYTAGMTGNIDNVYIDPLYTPSVIFDVNHHIRGVLLVKPGANVKFAGAVKMTCVVVGEPGGSLATNIMTFEGTGSAKYPLSTLPDETKFAGLKDLQGVFVIAPKWDVTLSGTFGTSHGSIVAEKVTFLGNTSATITGSLVNLGNYPLTVGGNTQLTLNQSGYDQIPGLRFTERFAPKKGSYKEVNAEKFAKTASTTTVSSTEPVTSPLEPVTSPLEPVTGSI